MWRKDKTLAFEINLCDSEDVSSNLKFKSCISLNRINSKLKYICWENVILEKV